MSIAEPPAVCGGHLVAPEGSLTSPDFRFEPVNVTCTWIVSTGDGARPDQIQLNFQTFDVGMDNDDDNDYDNDDDCQGDFVEIEHVLMSATIRSACSRRPTHQCRY